jgi:hypothetical protein
MDLTENNKWEHDPDLNKNLENRITAEPEDAISARTTPESKQLIPWDSYTYSIDSDIWYEYYRTILTLGAEANMNDYAFTKEKPHISFFSKPERDRFLKLCQQNGIKYKELKGEDKEGNETHIKSCVPSPSFRDIF